MANSDVLYGDKYIDVTNNEIILKKYYFPTKKSKNVSLSDIEYICTDEEYGVKPINLKLWGIGLNNIYWAWGSDGLSRPKYNYIIKVRNSNPQCGFSIENPEEFYKVIQSKGIQGIKKEN